MRTDSPGDIYLINHKNPNRRNALLIILEDFGSNLILRFNMAYWVFKGLSDGSGGMSKEVHTMTFHSEDIGIWVSDSDSKPLPRKDVGWEDYKLAHDSLSDYYQLWVCIQDDLDTNEPRGI